MPKLFDFLISLMSGEVGFVATRELCFLCCETLANRLLGTSDHRVREWVESRGVPKAMFPLFVTWRKKGQLRGCIGTFVGQPLVKGLEDFAVTAAMRDSRFTPMRKEELESLECEVSLLHSFEQCRDPLDWEIGKHGTTFMMDGYESTFLPEVAEKWKWTKEETLSELAMKAGLGRSVTKSDYPRIKIERYQSSHVQVTWAEYVQFASQLK